jgi:hypothetical protein
MNDNYTCDNCEFTAPKNEFNDALDLHCRLSAGSTFTDVECPHCNALAYPTEHTPPTTPLNQVSPGNHEEAEAFVHHILNTMLDINLSKKKDKLTSITLALAGYPNGLRQLNG